MGLEIERKFLVDPDPGAWPSSVVATRAWQIRQGYVTPPGSDPEVRVRLARPVDPAVAAALGTLQDGPRDADPHGGAAGDAPGGDAGPHLGESEVVRRLTTKASTSESDGDGPAVTRVEVEIDVDAGPFDELWAVTAGRRVEKVRIEYVLDDDAGTVLTVDHFAGRLRGLVLAEVEFEDEAASRAFRPPAFLWTDVSGDRRYRNAELAATDAPPDED